MNEEIERWADQQESLPDHLQRWAVFERPRHIWLARIVMHIGFWSFGQWLCGLRYETDEERRHRLSRYWDEEGAAGLDADGAKTA